jgi:hypothetical protein
LATALAIALVHQLGACPCGCIEGNLWVQTYLRVVRGKSQLLASSASKPGRSVDSKGCEGDHAHVAYVTGDSARVSHAFGVIDALAVLPDAAVVSDHGLARHRLGERHWPDIGPSARTLRAQLQIFLI